MKKSYLVSTAAALMLAMTGCGDGGDGSTSSTSALGTGYYVDNAVAGVDYVCGNQSGVTGVDGNFTFEVGKDCTFSLADVVLRQVNAANLVNNAKIVENNITVATFLQSIDNDGDLSNGIQISTEAREALVKTFETEGIQTVPSGNALNTVVSLIDQNLTNFNGSIPIEADVIAHLNNTESTVTKEILAGKTFYAVGKDLHNIADSWSSSITFNADMTQDNYVDPDTGETFTETITAVDGNKIMWGDGSYLSIDSQNTDYISVSDYNFDGTLDTDIRFYSDKAKADAYANTILNTTTPTSDVSPNLSAYNNIQIIKHVNSFIVNNINYPIDGVAAFNDYNLTNISEQITCADFGFTGYPSTYNNPDYNTTSYTYSDLSSNRLCTEIDYAQSISEVSGLYNIVYAVNAGGVFFAVENLLFYRNIP